MSDIGLKWSTSEFAADFAIEANDLAQDSGLETAVLLSLFTDAAYEGQGGWWADAVPAVEGDKTGSRLWRHARAKQTPSLASEIEQDVRDALQWMLDDKVAENIDVSAESSGAGILGISISIKRSQSGEKAGRSVPARAFEAPRTITYRASFPITLSVIL